MTTTNNVNRNAAGSHVLQVKEQIKVEISGYELPTELCCDSLNILLLGPAGAGKSSFFNTVNSVYKGHVTGQAVTGSAPEGVATKVQNNILLINFISQRGK